MNLANSNESLSDLITFASYSADGANIWVGGGSGCTLLSAPSSSESYTKIENQVCYAEYVSICEFDSEYP